MRRITFLTVVLFTGICCFGQNNDVKVYVAGSYMDGVAPKACYWVNEKIVPFDETERIEAIDVENGNVYVTGYHWYSSSYGRGYLFYYVNNEKKEVRGNRKYLAVDDIAACNGKVYITGYTDGDYDEKENHATWVDGTPIFDGGYKLTSSDGVIFSLIKYGENYSENFHAYGQKAQLDGHAFGISTANGSIYIAGETDQDTPCYWIDGVKYDVPNMYGNSRLLDIAALRNGSVQAIGRTTNKDQNIYFYFCDGKYLDIPNAEYFKKIYAFKDKIYLLGAVKKGIIKVPCYWVLSEVEGGLGIEKVVPLPNAASVCDILVTD